MARRVVHRSRALQRPAIYAESAALRATLPKRGSRDMLEMRLRDQQPDFREGRACAFLIADTLVPRSAATKRAPLPRKSLSTHVYIMMRMAVRINFRDLLAIPSIHAVLASNRSTSFADVVTERSRGSFRRSACSRAGGVTAINVRKPSTHSLANSGFISSLRN